MAKRVDYSNIQCVEQLNEEYNITPANIVEKKLSATEKENADKPDKVVNTDKIDVVYAEQHPKELKNIFKHIIVFTNDRDPKNNKTLKNILDAVDELKKKKAEIVPELHIFVAAEMVADDREEVIELTDGDEKFTIKDQTNLDTLVFSRLGVQGEDQCEHIVKLLQDRGFLVLNPVQYAALASDKYDTACLLEKGEIPQPKFCLMTKDILYDEKLYNDSLKEIYPNWDAKDNDKNEELMFVVKILDGHGGTGVALIDGKRLLAWLQLVFAIDPERRLIIQKKEEADGGDIRVHVLTLRNKQVILACMKRIKIANDFRSNVSLGASAEPVKLTPEQEQIALKTAQLSHLPWCAVDIMPLVKGSNKEIGDNVVLEINASPGTDGISDVIKENFVSILLNELDDPSEFMLQDKTAGFIEGVKVKFDDGLEKAFLAKLDTGNSTTACTLEVGEFTDTDNKVTFTIDGKKMTYDKIDTSKATVANGSEEGSTSFERPVIELKELTLGLRKVLKPRVAIVKSRGKKKTNMLLNRDTLAKLGYVVHPNNAHILTDEMQKVKII
jgi:glutathione synthase/RimK-type ligase-like ATP-grasp enzyme